MTRKISPPDPHPHSRKSPARTPQVHPGHRSRSIRPGHHHQQIRRERPSTNQQPPAISPVLLRLPHTTSPGHASRLPPPKRSHPCVPLVKVPPDLSVEPTLSVERLPDLFKGSCRTLFSTLAPVIGASDTESTASCGALQGPLQDLASAARKSGFGRLFRGFYLVSAALVSEGSGTIQTPSGTVKGMTKRILNRRH